MASRTGADRHGQGGWSLHGSKLLGRRRRTVVMSCACRVSSASYCPVTCPHDRWGSALNTTGGHGDGGAGHRRRHRSGTHGRGRLPRRRPHGGDRRRPPRRPRGRRQGTRRRRDRRATTRTRPASKRPARQFPHHLDTIINVPAPRWAGGDPRTYSLSDQAAAWRNALESTVLSAVLTVQILGDHLRSGGSIVSIVPEHPRDGSADAAIKAAVSNWTAGQATHFGTRGITVNAVASGRSAEPGYDGPVVHAARGRRRDHPAGNVFGDTRRAPHQRSDAARQQRSAGQLRLRSPFARVKRVTAPLGVSPSDDSTRTPDPELLLRHRRRRTLSHRHRPGAGSRGSRLRFASS